MEEFRTMAARLWEDGEREPDRLVQDFITEVLGSPDPASVLSPLLLDMAQAEFSRLRRINGTKKSPARTGSASPRLPALPGVKNGVVLRGDGGTAAMADTMGELETAEYGRVTATLTAALTLTPLQVRQSLMRDTVWVHGRGNVPWREVTIDDVSKTIRFYRQAKTQAITTYDARLAFMAEAQQLMRKYNVNRLGQALDRQAQEKVAAAAAKRPVVQATVQKEIEDVKADG